MQIFKITTRRMLAIAAVSASGKLDGVVTRDVKDFRGRVTVPVLSAAQALKLVGWKAR